MKFGWLLFHYVPPDLKLSRAQRREARRRARNLFRSTPRTFLTSFGIAIMLGVVWAGVSAFFTYLDPLVLRGYYPLLVIGAWASSVVFAWIALALAGRMMYSRAHREALREMGYDVCALCGYWLRGLPPDASRCPECGAPHEPVPESSGAALPESKP